MVDSIFKALSFVSILSFIPLSSAAGPLPVNHQNCRCMPSDKCWPSVQDWNSLNATVGGRLSASVPLGSPCHYPNYDAAQCKILQDAWTGPIIFEGSPTALMSGYFQGESCSPFTSPNITCTLGNIPNYTINVSSAADISAGVKFAQDKNIRFVVKNTGHDFLGKSTGKGSLGLWTHNLNSVEVNQNYRSSYYNGPAIKMGAGVRGADVLPIAQKAGLAVVSGSCPSVGLVGGFTQGGGHSSLTSSYGMGADQALEWEVILADGSHVFANPNKNTDLYWALSGGGPGTYGVVVSLTVRAYKDVQVGGASLQFTPFGVTNDTYWKGIEAWHEILPSLADAGASTGFLISSSFFLLQPMTLPGADKATIQNLLSPFTTKLDSLKITYSLNITAEPTYLDHYSLYLGPLPGGAYPVDRLMGGRFIPRSVVKNNNAGYTAVVREIAETTQSFYGAVSLSSNIKNRIAPNAILPQWRDTLISVLAQTQWEYGKPIATNMNQLNELNQVIIPKLTAVAPDAGAYLNEANFALKTWKEDFYGVNYNRLRAIKKDVDPKDLFYGPTMVGSDAWSVAADGRLCRA